MNVWPGIYQTMYFGAGPKSTENIYCLKRKLQNSIHGFAALTPNCLLRTMHREREKTKAALPAQ